MKALTLTQPWASGIFKKAKLIETRSWKLSKNTLKQVQAEGLLIHAGKGKAYGFDPNKIICRNLSIQEPFNSVIGGMRGYDELPFGAILGKVDLIDILPTEQIIKHPVLSIGGHTWYYNDSEEYWGDYSPGRYGWLLANPVLFPQPIPYAGSQSIWDYPFEI
jgi:hypothetical protein